MTLHTILGTDHLRRPPLRVQLTALYAGLVLAVLAAVLLATGVLYKHQAAAALPGHAAPGAVGDTQTFDFGPALIALAAATVAVAAAWWLAGRFLRPLRTITSTAREISATDLHRRLALAGPDDELTELGRTLDDLFARLQASFEAQRHFIANASHELRTPLAGQRTLLQVALADPAASADNLRAACEEALELGDQQERLINALLTLATGEKGIEQRETIDLADLAATVIAVHQQDAERKQITINSSLQAAPINGDPDLVERMTTNLLDNAIRHNITGGTISITTSRDQQRSRLTISNTGPVLNAQDLQQLFQPFRRGGSERISKDGHGLGLAIVKAIADAHAATLTAAHRADGGLDLTVTFPA
jgi:signal transduction histidine kinase